MPTSPLLVLRSLLRLLSLPIRLEHLSNTTPSLLLLLLESLLGRRLPLSDRLRHPAPEHEVELAKCILGVLAVELAMDLSVVNPERVVEGREDELAAVVMGLAALARRKGVDVDLDQEESVENEAASSLGRGSAGSAAVSRQSRYAPSARVASSSRYLASTPAQSAPSSRRSASVRSTSLRSTHSNSLRSHSAHSASAHSAQSANSSPLISLLDEPVDPLSTPALQPHVLDMYTTPPRGSGTVGPAVAIGDIDEEVDRYAYLRDLRLERTYPDAGRQQDGYGYDDYEDNTRDAYDQHDQGYEQQQAYEPHNAHEHPCEAQYAQHQHTLDTSVASSLRSPSPTKGRQPPWPVRPAARISSGASLRTSTSSGSSSDRYRDLAKQPNPTRPQTHSRSEIQAHEDDFYEYHYDPHTNKTFALPRKRTVLQNLLDEFGLAPG